MYVFRTCLPIAYDQDNLFIKIAFTYTIAYAYLLWNSFIHIWLPVGCRENALQPAPSILSYLFSAKAPFPSAHLHHSFNQVIYFL